MEIDASSLKMFKARLGGAWTNLWKVALPMSGGKNKMHFKGPFPTKPFWDSMSLLIKLFLRFPLPTNATVFNAPVLSVPNRHWEEGWG